MSEIILNVVSDHVKKEFGLDDSYTLIKFNAGTFSVTFRSEGHEITVKVVGHQAIHLNNLISDIQCELEDAVDYVMDEEIEELIEDSTIAEEIQTPTKKFKKA